MVGMCAYLQRGVHRSWSSVTRAAVPACVPGGPWSDEASTGRFSILGSDFLKFSMEIRLGIDRSPSANPVSPLQAPDSATNPAHVPHRRWRPRRRRARCWSEGPGLGSTDPPPGLPRRHPLPHNCVGGLRAAAGRASRFITVRGGECGRRGWRPHRVSTVGVASGRPR